MLSNAVILAAAGLVAAYLAFSLASGTPVAYTIATRAFLAGALGVLILFLKAPAGYKTKLSIVLVSSGISLLAADFILGAIPDSFPSGRSKILSDMRSHREVVTDLRSDGVDAHPTISSRVLRKTGSELNFEGVVPLGGIANTTIVFCNESGDWIIYESDEHGFHNPRGLWDQETLDIVSIGDSLTHGMCVESEANVSALIRNVYPRTLNLGRSGAGPLSELAIMKEYLAKLKPRVVLWFFYEGNDLQDLNEEYGSLPTLRRYLETDFRQGLRSKQAVIDRGWRSFVDRTLAAPEEIPREGRTLRSRLGLRELRYRVLSLVKWDEGCILTGMSTPTLFGRILRDAKRHVDLWQGDLYFVYLPNSYKRLNVTCHDQVVSIVNNIGIPIIDLADVIGDYPDLASLYPSGLPQGTHYNEDGYRLIAEAVLEAINRDY